MGQTIFVFDSVEELAKAKGVSMAQIAIAWALHKPGVSAPIVGTTSLKNLEDIIGEFVMCEELLDLTQHVTRRCLREAYRRRDQDLGRTIQTADHFGTYLRTASR